MAGTWRYVRAATDLSLQRALPGRVRVTTTVSGGTSSGGLPTHRLWNLGGWQTVRGVRDGARLSVGGSVGMIGLPIRLDAARAPEPASRWQVNLYAPIRS